MRSANLQQWQGRFDHDPFEGSLDAELEGPDIDGILISAKQKEERRAGCKSREEYVP